jgi:hypothetical protein
MVGKLSLKQAFLRTIIVAVVASALMGIYAFLFRDFGETEAKILLTTLSVTYFSVTSLACVVALEKKRGGLLAPVGLATGVLGFLVFVPGIWAEWHESEAIGKSMAVLGIFAFALAQGCLLALVPLKRSIRWVFLSTVVAVLAAAALVSAMIVFETHEEWLVRFAGVLGILDGCGSLTIPLLYKLGHKADELALEAPLDRIELRCPRCGHRDTYPIGSVQCQGCSLELRVEIAANSTDQRDGGSPMETNPKTTATPES